MVESHPIVCLYCWCFISVIGESYFILTGSCRPEFVRCNKGVALTDTLLRDASYCNPCYFCLTANLIQLGVSEMEGLVENTDAFMVSSHKLLSGPVIQTRRGGRIGRAQASSAHVLRSNLSRVKPMTYQINTCRYLVWRSAKIG